MYRGRRVVVVTPAGRRRYMRLLVPQILGLRDVVDEYRIWQNTEDATNIQYFQSLAAEHPDFVTVETLPPGVKVTGCITICRFFRNCADPDTVYVRFDDDIVLLDSLEAFKALLDFRIDNPRYFLVYGTVLNNSIITHVLQRIGALDVGRGKAGYGCMDPTGWRCPHFAEHLHRQVLAAPSLERFRMPVNWDLFHNERVSINCICWLGAEFAAFGGAVGPDEEQWLSVDKPRALRRINCVFGGFVAVHFAFESQRPGLEATDVLARYAERLGAPPPGDPPARMLVPFKGRAR